MISALEADTERFRGKVIIIRWVHRACGVWCGAACVCVCVRALMLHVHNDHSLCNIMK